MTKDTSKNYVKHLESILQMYDDAGKVLSQKVMHWVCLLVPKLRLTRYAARFSIHGSDESNS
jgi:hypothetical protein